MILRPNVSIWGIKPPLVLALNTIDNIVRGFPGLPELEITHVTDGVHGKGSLHPSGLAADIHCRSWGPMVQKVLAKIKTSLGPHFDVILEDAQDLKGNIHIHVEYDPKTKI